MDTRKLHYFVTIVDSGAITRAAELLYVAQPALSQHVAALESEFGQQLLVRSSKGIEMTSAGRSLYRYARGILRLEEAVRHDIAGDLANPSGTVAVGLASYTQFSILMIPIVRAIRSRYPRVMVRTFETLSIPHSQAIRMGQLDAGLIYKPIGEVGGVCLERVLTEDLCVVLPKGTAASGFTEEGVSLDRLTEFDFVLPRRENPLRHRLEEAFYNIGAELRVALEVENTHPLIEAVESGLGATVLPRTAAELMFGNRDDVICPIVNPSLSVTLCLAIADDKPLSRAAEVVIDTLREFTLSG